MDTNLIPVHEGDDVLFTALEIARSLFKPWSSAESELSIRSHADSISDLELQAQLIQVADEISSGKRLPREWSLTHYDVDDRVEIVRLSVINQILLEGRLGWQGRVLSWKPATGILKIKWSDGYISNSMTSMGDSFINHRRTEIPGPPEYML